MRSYAVYFVFVLLCNDFLPHAETVQRIGNAAPQAREGSQTIVSATEGKAHSEATDRDDRRHFAAKHPDTEVSTLRPRLFVRADKDVTGKGLTVSALRSRIADPAYKDWIDYTGGIDGWASLPGVAMQYLLKGDRSDALAVGEYIVSTPFSFKEHTSAAAMVYNSAIAFDWIRNALTDEMASAILARLVEGAEHLKEGVISPAINHNYSIVSLYGVAMVAMAIYGESDEYNVKASAYLEIVNNLLLGDHMLFDTFKEKQGTWGEGNHYTPFVVFYPVLMTLRGLTTATGTDYFRIIRDEYENFIAPMSKFVIANFRPDFTLERIGDVTGRVVPHKTFMRPLIDLLASEIRDQHLQGQVHSFAKEMSEYYGPDLVPDVYGWMMLVTYDAQIPDKPSYKTLPPVMRLGENSYEHIMFRNQWGEDGTLITFLSGDHYTDHQHFDKGHFLIYKHGGLVVDGGGYSRMYGDSWSNYSSRTLAHNNVLVHDPDETSKKGIMDTEIYPDGGQRVIRGAQSFKSWKEFEDKADDFGLHTAEVLAFDANDQLHQYNYVKSNLTNAYGDNVVWMDRQLLYLPQTDYLLVKDRVITVKPFHNYWLLHFEERPLIDGQTPTPGVRQYRNASIVQSQRTGELVLEGKTVPYSGRLFVKTLLPARRTISIIGGPGYEYYNRFSKMNFSAPEKSFGPNREPGHWRIEVNARKPSTETAFLHAFEISDSKTKAMIPTDHIRSEDGKMDGAFFRSSQNPYVVLFSSSLDPRGHPFQRARIPIEYKVRTTAPASHVLAELEPDKKVEVYINDAGIGTFQTSKAGVLFFKDAGSGVRRIRIQEE